MKTKTTVQNTASNMSLAKKLWSDDIWSDVHQDILVHEDKNTNASAQSMGVHQKILIAIGIVAVSLTPMFLGGCAVGEERAYEDESGWYDEDATFNYLADSTYELTEGAAMRGEIGSQRVNERASVNQYSQDDYSDVEVVAATPNGAAMHLLFFSGGLQHESLVPGSRHTFINGQPNEQGLAVDVIACEGDEVYDWSYDEPASEVRVDVSESDEPGMVQIDYEVTAPSPTFGDAVSSGTFLTEAR